MNIDNYIQHWSKQILKEYNEPSWKSYEAGIEWDDDELAPKDLGGDKYQLVRNYTPEDGEWRGQYTSSNDIYDLINDFCKNGDRDADECWIEDKNGVRDKRFKNTEALEEIQKKYERIYFILKSQYVDKAWEQFKQHHGKTLNQEDDFKDRRKWFISNLKILPSEQFELTLPKYQGKNKEYPETKIQIKDELDAKRITENYPLLFIDLYQYKD